VHASDLHIDGAVRPPGYQDASPAPARDLTRRAVVRLVDLVLRERAELLIISGDVFDRAADSQDAGQFFAAQADRLHDAGVPVLVAAGNHDAVCRRATAGVANVTWFAAGAPETFRFDDLGVAVHGQGLANPVEPGDLSPRFPAPVPGYVNIGVLHTSLDGRASRTICAPTSAAALAAKGYDYWALGHVHERRVVATAPWVVFPGNPQGRGPTESGPKGATVITTAAGRITGVDHRELAVLRWEHTDLDCTGARGVDDALERVWQRLAASPAGVPADGRPVMLDLTVTGTESAPSLEQVRAVTRTRSDLVVHHVS
jgi:DNA repair exonuclease SbcCD nuclease subunit